MGNDGAAAIGEDGKAIGGQFQLVDGIKHLVDGNIARYHLVGHRHGDGEHQLAGIVVNIGRRGDDVVGGFGILIPGAGSGVITAVIGGGILILHMSLLVPLIGA